MKWLPAVILLFSSPLMATATQVENPHIPNMIEDLNPFDPNIEEMLQEYDRIYEMETGKPAHLPDFGELGNIIGMEKCYRAQCPVWIHVNKSTQSFALYLHGSPHRTGLVSTGVSGYGTPNFDRHPNGRVYDAYTSGKYPGGDYNGLGNMPYAVFIQGGFALHGTPQPNWRLLGKHASHGCIRMHPDNGYILNRLVRQYGVAQTWITVN